jgi:hypothetical protein
VSWSEISTARQCPLKHQLSYIERWSKNPDVMSPLSKGTAWHLVMETHYKRLMEIQRTRPAGVLVSERAILASCREKVSVLIEDRIKPLSTDLADLIEWMYVGYLAEHGADKGWRVLAVEHFAECRLPTPRGRPSGFVLKMKIDLIVADVKAKPGPDGQPLIWVVDHKSGKNLPKGKEMDLDDQFGLYTWGLNRLGKNVFGQIHNAARTERLVGETSAWKAKGYRPGAEQSLDARFARTRTYRTEPELHQVAIEAYLTMRARYADHRVLAKMGEDAARHTDTQTCKWKCDFLDPCLAGRKMGGDQMRDYLDAKGFRKDFDRH